MHEQIGFAHLKTCPDNLVLIKLKLLVSRRSLSSKDTSIKCDSVLILRCPFSEQISSAVKQI